MSITHPGDLEIDMALVKEAYEGTRDKYDMTKRYITKSGKTIWILLRVSSLRDGKSFVCFLAQVLPLKGQAALPKPEPKKTTFSWITDHWPIIITLTSAISIIAAQVITYLMKGF